MIANATDRKHSLAAACAAYGISVLAVRNWIARGHLPELSGAGTGNHLRLTDREVAMLVVIADLVPDYSLSAACSHARRLVAVEPDDLGLNMIQVGQAGSLGVNVAHLMDERRSKAMARAA
ncbi:hypothetical protein BHAOGJBA_1709 [Methylobacterium hispanicum]|uniref:HTH merR-type domain-containing protein n=1 Tax=Methylobacterium hispanicum TaxID=270350 RepID=A0AAV4ZK26_9HYPH|nr:MULTISPECIES: hypothetical protein [Methylobacterium]GJD88196.1 hypothetical protein BHAOGJBA_1709 [Methylobacterium hispanicum]